MSDFQQMIDVRPLFSVIRLAVGKYIESATSYYVVVWHMLPPYHKTIEHWLVHLPFMLQTLFFWISVSLSLGGLKGIDYRFFDNGCWYCTLSIALQVVVSNNTCWVPFLPPQMDKVIAFFSLFALHFCHLTLATHYYTSSVWLKYSESVTQRFPFLGDKWSWRQGAKSSQIWSHPFH